MDDPLALPKLDRVKVSVIPGDAEQLCIPGEFTGNGGKDLPGGRNLRAS